MVLVINLQKQKGKGGKSMENKNRTTVLRRALAWVIALAVAVSILTVPNITAEAAGSVTSITVSNLPAKTLTLKKGKTFTLKTKVAVTGGASKAVTYKSSKTKVATVDSKGKIKAKKKGKTTITITSKADSKKTFKVTVTVGTPVSKVTIAGNGYTGVGVKKTTKLKATVLTKKASNKKVVWTSSNTKVATVSSKGVVKGIKKGTATITATAADGSGKKAKVKVYVTDPVAIKSVSVINALSVQVVLKKAQRLSVDNFKVYTKTYDAGTYNRSCVVDSVTTKDNKTYTVTLNSNSILAENRLVKVKVKGLVGSDSKETRFNLGKFTYTLEEIRMLVLNEEYSTTVEPSGSGYNVFSVSGLPAGIKYEISKDGTYVRYYGIPTKAGTYNSTLKCKDELGNVRNYTVKFVVGSDTVIAATAATTYGYTQASGECSVSSKIYATGGSNSYTYAIQGASYGLEVSTSGYLSGTLKAKGNYNVKVKVTDATNTSRYTVVTVPIKIVQGLSVVGIAKDLNGNPIRNAYIQFTNKDKASNYLPSAYTYTDDKGSYSIFLPSGTYDIRASIDDTVAYIYNRSITTSKSGYDISIPVYKVVIYSGDSKVSAENFGSWYDDTYTKIGSGDILYLKAGTYKLHTNEDSYDATYNYKATVNVTVSSKTASTTAAIKFIKAASANSIALNGSVTVSLTSEYRKFAFRPTASGTYYFYSTSSADTYGRLYDADGNTIKSNDDGGSGNNFLISYNCTAGTTYYIGIKAYGTSYVGYTATLHVTNTYSE
jgi:uncharacterized protein YjdB